MPKIRLDVDTLHVDSFDTAPAGGAERGTVRAHAPSVWPEPCAPTDRVTDCGQQSCAITCNDNTCWATCYATCYLGCDPGTGGCTSVTCVPRQCMG